MKRFLTYSCSSILLVLFLLACGTEGADNVPPSSVSLKTELVEVNPFTFSFTASAIDGNFDPLTYTWDFGEGTVREGREKETFTYEENQEYTVTVTVSDGNGGQASTSQQISTMVHDITIDPSTTLQTIEGFGGFGAQKPWWKNPPFYDQAFVDRLINDLGLTILRDNIPTGFEYQNDNDDPYTLNLDGFNLYDDKPEQDGPLGDHFDYLRAMRQAGVEKFITSIWSPPAWMKQCNCVRGEEAAAPDPSNTDHKLDPRYYQEFAEYCVAYIKVLKQETGIDLYALSLQNEPAFVQSYASSVYSPEALRDVIKVVGKRFEEEGIGTKIFAPEDVAYFPRVKEYLVAIENDDSARAYTDILAIHNYKTDGVNPGDQGPSNWAETYGIAQANSQQVWMTETSGFEDTWDGAMNLSQSIYNALKYGKINAWVFWSLSSPDPQYSLISDGDPNPVYYVSKHFYRYIRPGAVQLQSSSDNDDILVLAYRHPSGGTETVILINLSESGKAVKISSNDFPSILQGLRSSESEQSKVTGEINTQNILLLPGRTITTYYTE